MYYFMMVNVTDINYYCIRYILYHFKYRKTLFWLVKCSDFLRNTSKDADFPLGGTLLEKYLFSYAILAGYRTI